MHHSVLNAKTWVDLPYQDANNGIEKSLYFEDLKLDLEKDSLKDLFDAAETDSIVVAGLIGYIKFNNSLAVSYKNPFEILDEILTGNKKFTGPLNNLPIQNIYFFKITRTKQQDNSYIYKAEYLGNLNEIIQSKEKIAKLQVAVIGNNSQKIRPEDHLGRAVADAKTVAKNNLNKIIKNYREAKEIDIADFIEQQLYTQEEIRTRRLEEPYASILAGNFNEIGIDKSLDEIIQRSPNVKIPFPIFKKIIDNSAHILSHNPCSFWALIEKWAPYIEGYDENKDSIMDSFLENFSDSLAHWQMLERKGIILFMLNLKQCKDFNNDKAKAMAEEALKNFETRSVNFIKRMLKEIPTKDTITYISQSLKKIQDTWFLLSQEQFKNVISLSMRFFSPEETLKLILKYLDTIVGYDDLQVSGKIKDAMVAHFIEATKQCYDGANENDKNKLISNLKTMLDNTNAKYIPQLREQVDFYTPKLQKLVDFLNEKHKKEQESKKLEIEHSHKVGDKALLEPDQGFKEVEIERLRKEGDKALLDLAKALNSL
jgi:hypothetical protein